MDQMEGNLRKACPNLPVEALDAVLKLMALSRNDWISATAMLITEEVDGMADDESAGAE